jgi:hypothetical protein
MFFLQGRLSQVNYPLYGLYKSMTRYSLIHCQGCDHLSA